MTLAGCDQKRSVTPKAAVPLKKEMTTANDADPLRSLVEAAVTGDASALESVCMRLSGPVYRLALRMLQDPSDAEDASQEILVQVVTHLSQFRGDSKVLTWVYTIATRHLLRFRRGRKEHSVSPDTIAAVVDAGLAATQPGDLPEGEAKVLEREVRLACTQNMLFALTREERIAVILVEVLGADDALAASICDIKPVAFRQRLSRARRKLRPVLEERCGLHNPSSSCRCMRQAAARQRLQPSRSPKWTILPVEDQARVSRAQDQLRSVNAMGAVFAIDPPIAPPSDLWETIASKLPDVLQP